MAIQVPSDPLAFAVYSTKRSTILLGYEYEIDSPDYGPPIAVGWVGEVDEELVRIHRPRNANYHPIKDLPRYYHLNYEPLGHSRMGYEIKSPVAPLSIHKVIIKRWLFPNVRFNSKPNGVHNRGSIHVSVSNNEHTSPHANKVFKFLHITMPRAFQHKLSERSLDTLNCYARQTKYADQHTAISNNANYSWKSHYAVINNENNNRYEFRLFAGQKHLLIPALEMADSLFQLARDVEALTMES